MKIIIVGASGRIGKEVDKALSDSHEIVRVGVRSGDVQCDYTNIESVRGMFEKIGESDISHMDLPGNTAGLLTYQYTTPYWY
jgi:dTDP-4-dehydrorhamnose reductase